MNDEGFFLKNKKAFNSPDEVHGCEHPPLIMFTTYFRMYRAKGNDLEALPWDKSER